MSRVAAGRRAAYHALRAVTSGRADLPEALARARARLDDARDQAFAANVTAGTLRWMGALDALVEAFSGRRAGRLDAEVLDVLRIGAFQLLHLERVPPRAVIDDAVDLVRELRKSSAAGFVNAVLRRFLREREALGLGANDDAVINHPAWLIDAFRRDWPDDWQSLLAANDERAPMWLRVNRQRTNPSEYRAMLAGVGLAASDMPGWPDALRLDTPAPVEELPGFATGLVSVQDAAAQLAAPWLLDGRAGRVLDACAAPGGKSAHLKEIGAGAIDLVALDRDPDRVGAIAATFDRLGLAATILTGDASTPAAWHQPPPYAAILLDAPCSATGVIRRHPDIKHLRRAGDIPALAALQRRLLEALWPLLEPGGRLLYVTCSVLAAENDAVVGDFLGATASARESTMLQNNNIRDVMRRKACGYQLLPGMSGMDGFYFACLDKVS
jgi:16S rRNA (cytosine967-C5)-methyltransferase